MADGITATHHPSAERKPYQRPLLVQFRYRCDCVGREVLSESCVLDLDMPEEQFMWTMRRLREDILAEVAQHIKKLES